MCKYCVIRWELGRSPRAFVTTRWILAVGMTLFLTEKIWHSNHLDWCQTRCAEAALRGV